MNFEYDESNRGRKQGVRLGTEGCSTVDLVCTIAICSQVSGYSTEENRDVRGNNELIKGVTAKIQVLVDEGRRKKRGIMHVGSGVGIYGGTAENIVDCTRPSRGRG